MVHGDEADISSLLPLLLFAGGKNSSSSQIGAIDLTEGEQLHCMVEGIRGDSPLVLLLLETDPGGSFSDNDSLGAADTEMDAAFSSPYRSIIFRFLADIV